MKKIKGIDIFLPWVESIGLVLYCYLMVLFNLKFQPPIWFCLIFFFPLAGFEIYLSARCDNLQFFSAKGIIFLFFRLFFLFSFYFLWAWCFRIVVSAWEFHPQEAGAFVWMASHQVYFLQIMKLVVYARPGIDTVLLGILLLSYYIFFVRLRKGRFLTSIFLPWLLLFGLLIIFYMDIFGGVSRRKVESQPDVKIFFPYPVADFARGRISARINTFHSPRFLQIDEGRKKLYLAFGSSFPELSGFPNFLEIDLENRNWRIAQLLPKERWSKLIRGFDSFSDPERIFLTSWSKNFYIYIISKENFEVLEKIYIGSTPKIKCWEPYYTFYNKRGDTVYVANGEQLLLVGYHLKEKKVEVIDLTEITGLGALPTPTRLSPVMNKIYMVSTADRRRGFIMEFEPSPLKLVRFKEIPGWWNMEIDEKRKTLLLMHGFGKQLWEMDIEKFEIIKKIELPILFCRKILIDNNFLWCLDYLRGRVFLVDRDTGKVYKRYWVGNKPMGIVKFGGRIFVASALGIIEIKFKNENSL